MDNHLVEFIVYPTDDLCCLDSLIKIYCLGRICKKIDPGVWPYDSYSKL